MNEQLELFDKESRERFGAWAKFHRENPKVWLLFKKFAESARQRGRRSRFGARMIGERIRWYTTVETNDPDYKVNDHHWPYYARLLMLTDANFAEFFELRLSRSDAPDQMILDAHQDCWGAEYLDGTV